MRISVSKAVSLADETIAIAVSGCRSLQPITLQLTVSESFGRFYSLAHYLADASGEVRTERDYSQGGSFVGRDPMGLFWSMRQEKGQRPGLRFLRRNAAEPINYRLQALPGHIQDPVSATTADKDANSDSVSLFQRTYLSQDVTRTPVSIGRLRGCLFSPSGDGAHPGVLDLFGLGGGLMEHRAALLASKGFTVLALAYFGYADLPKQITEFDLDYFVEALRYLLGHPKVLGPRGLGVIGTSAGAGLAAELAAQRRPEVVCVAWLNGMHCRILHPVRYAGQVLPQALPDFTLTRWSRVNEAFEVRAMSACYDANAGEEHAIRVEESDAQFLFVSSMADEGIPNYTGQLLAERLSRKGKTNYRLLQCPRAGHMLEPPYSPLNRYVYHGTHGAVADYGGHPYWHNLAQIDVWRELQSFFKRNLSP